jgi:hypothetical protein
MPEDVKTTYPAKDGEQSEDDNEDRPAEQSVGIRGGTAPFGLQFLKHAAAPVELSRRVGACRKTECL